MKPVQSTVAGSQEKPNFVNDIRRVKPSVKRIADDILL